MQNNFIKFIIILTINFFIFQNVTANEQFNFEISEIEILENGNKIQGIRRGKIITNDGISIESDKFIYDKIQNILKAKGNIIITDEINDYKIFSDEIIYEKNDETLVLNSNVKADIYSRYNLTSENIIFLRDEMSLNSNDKTTVIDKINNRLYNFGKFVFLINEEILKGENILVNTDYNEPFNEKLYLSSGIFDLKNQSHVAKDVEIYLKKNVFGIKENDPRLKGVSSSSEKDMLKITKGVFTSCKKSDKCPPWAIKAEEIKHDKNKKQIIYKNAFLEIYDVPILYFPKFFHPDPSVSRQSGLLKPAINNSNILGSSLRIPYFKVLADNKDFTFTPTIFDNDLKMFQNEYRQVNENSSFIADIAFVDGYQSSIASKKNSLGHFFADYEKDLEINDYINGKINFSIEKTNNDTYLKIFDSNLLKNNTTPDDYDILSSELKLTLNNENFNFASGFQSYEDLSLINSDRYQFVLPYYEFDKQIFQQFKNGIISFSSSGRNDLKDTNNLRSRVINDINFQSLDLFTENGFKNNLNIYLKNSNTVGKNDSIYKSSPQIELMSLIELNSSYPLIKQVSDKFINTIIPKISFRLNPGDMKNNSDEKKSLNVNNIFDINRLGLEDSFEQGESLTLGLDFKKDSISDINKYFELKLASVMRNKTEDFIPKTTTLNNKSSNLFGSVTTSLNKNVKFDYNFSLDNSLDTFDYNSFDLDLKFGNLSTKLNFIEETNLFGNTNVIENTTEYKFGEKNYLSFNTRRNRKINLTEYYNFAYEYKYDCLVAGIKYNKTYYEDRDLKPSENLLFSITLYPLTTIEQKLDQ